MLCVKLAKWKKEKDNVGGGPKEVISSFAWEGLGFMKDMASELDFTSSCVFLLSVTLRLSSSLSLDFKSFLIVFS